MRQTRNSFAITSALSLIIGLSLAAARDTEMSLGWPGSRGSYGIPVSYSFYVVASLFALFAFIYAIPRIPFSERLARWHFWSSVFGAVLFAVGYSVLVVLGKEFLASRATRGPSQEEMALSFLGLALGPAVFWSGQVLFLICLIKAIRQMFRNTTEVG